MGARIDKKIINLSAAEILLSDGDNLFLRVRNNGVSYGCCCNFSYLACYSAALASDQDLPANLIFRNFQSGTHKLSKM